MVAWLRGVGSLGGEREEVKTREKTREKRREGGEEEGGIYTRKGEGVGKLGKKEASEGWREDK